MKKLLVMSSLIILASSSGASAHVTANPDNGIAGKYFQTSFRISHGCEGSDTVSVHIKIPPGLVTLKPQHKQGWTVETKKRKLPAPVPAGHGRMADEEFSDVIWSGGSLPNDQYDEFGLLVKLPEGKEQKLWFPVTQTCVKGTNEWKEIPSAGQEWHELKSPAPFVTVIPKPESDAHHHSH